MSNFMNALSLQNNRGRGGVGVGVLRSIPVDTYFSNLLWTQGMAEETLVRFQPAPSLNFALSKAIATGLKGAAKLKGEYGTYPLPELATLD